MLSRGGANVLGTLLCLLFIVGMAGCGSGSSVNDGNQGEGSTPPHRQSGRLIGLNNKSPTPCEHGFARRGSKGSEIVFVVECDPKARKLVESNFSVSAETGTSEKLPYPKTVRIGLFTHMLTADGQNTEENLASCGRERRGSSLVCRVVGNGKAEIMGSLVLADRTACNVYVSIVAQAPARPLKPPKCHKKGKLCSQSLDLLQRQIFDAQPRGC